MNYSDAELLLNELRCGHKTPADLTGEQFQNIVFHKLIRQCGGSDDFQYELLDDYRGAVDFVVREVSSHISQFQTEHPLHMFECKHYSRTLELSTVAKLLVVGVRYQPMSLNIVSGTNLQPQVYEYARFLFNGLGNDTALFQRTFFRHFKTSDLLDLQLETEGFEFLNPLPKEAAKVRIADVSWEIVELRPFVQKILTASGKPNGKALFDVRWKYKLMASLFTDYNPDQLKIWVSGLSDTENMRQPNTEVLNFDGKRHQIRFVQMIDPQNIDNASKENLELHITYATRSHKVLTIPISAVQTDSDNQSHFPELRLTESRRFSERLHNKTAPRVMFLSGLAGVGKTRLCENIASELRNAGEFEINRFSADSYGESSLLSNMFVTVCTPATARSESYGNEWQELAASILKALSPISGNAFSRESETEAAELLIPAFAELMVRTGARAIVLRDAHLLSEKSAQEIFALIKRLDDLGWGDIYWIIEYRTPEAENNPYWRRFQTEIRSRIDTAVDKRLEPLTAPVLDSYLDSIFKKITPELRSMMWKMSGGVPLYLFSIIDVLAKGGAIKPLTDGHWTIEAPSQFHRLSKTGLRADEVLKKRLEAVSWEKINFPQKLEKSPMVFVALLGIAREPVRVKKLCELCGIKEEEYDSVRRNLLHHNIIHQDLNKWAIDFQHDLLRHIAIEVGRDETSAPAFVEEILSVFREKRSSVSDYELFADLAAWIGFREDAIQALNAAFELLRTTDNFTQTHRILTGLCQNLEPDAFVSTQNYIRYLASRSALAWTTWNVGSLTEARNEFSQIAADAVAGIDSVIDQTTAEAYAADAERRVLGINLELEDVPAFVQSAERCLELSSQTVVFNSVLNRLILYCARFSHPELGVEFSKLAISVFGEPEIESSGAVICSDIGNLFRATSSSDALALYRQGVKLASDARQRTYNELDVLITEMISTGREMETDELDKWYLKLSENGLRPMLARFNLFRASVEMQSGRIEAAQRIYEHLETFISVYKHEYFRLAVWNDAMIAALVREDFKQTYKLQRLIIDKLERLLGERKIAFTRLKSLMPKIETRIKRNSSYLKSLDINIPEVKPIYSGIMPQILLNLENLGNIKGAVKKNNLKKARQLFPADINRLLAEEAYENILPTAKVDFHKTKLVLCTQ